MERFRNLLGGSGMSLGGAAHGTVSLSPTRTDAMLELGSTYLLGRMMLTAVPTG